MPANEKRDKIIEIMIYFMVPFVFLVVCPLVGKSFDAVILKTSYIFAPELALLIIGVPVTLVGIGLAFWTIFIFKTIGQGTPNPKIPPKKLVTTGPYRIVRNPMALGGTILLMGETLFYYSLFRGILTILYTIVLYLNAMHVEEPGLQKRFGNDYENYLKEVPRFFPRLVKPKIK